MKEKASEVHTYILNCSVFENTELFNKYYSLLGKQRRKKIDTCRFDNDRRLSLGAGVLLNELLADFDVNNIALSEYGKPYIKGSPLSFSLSHSGELAALAVSESEVGCDIEKVRPIDFRIAKKYFFNTEYEALQNEANEDKRLELFFRLWTLKESFIKAAGLGFQLGLNKFEIGFENEEPFVNQSLNDYDYSFFEYKLPSYRLAVCAEGKAEFCRVREIELT